VVNAASDKAPAGARGHRVMLTREARKRRCLRCWHGGGLPARMDGHDARRKIGLLTEANLVGRRLVVSGYLYARDFPKWPKRFWRTLLSDGDDYELADARVEICGRGVEADPRDLYRAAILLREKAATKRQASAWQVSGSASEQIAKEAP